MTIFNYVTIGLAAHPLDLLAFMAEPATPLKSCSSIYHC